MSDYPNMSYVMCENTNNALQQILEEMAEYTSVRTFVDDLSATEKASFEQILSIAYHLMNRVDAEDFDL